MPRSGIREVMDRSRTLVGCIHLEVGEPSFPTPSHVVEAAVQALREGATKYAPNAGLAVLRESIVDKVRARNAIEANVDQVIVTVGGVQGLYSALQSVTEPGDHVLLPDPGWPNYMMIAHLLHLQQDRYQLRRENGFLPTVEDLEARVTPRTRAIVLNTPSNPLGTILPAPLLKDVCEFAGRHDLYVVSDEVYDELTFEPGFASAAAAGDPDRIITCFSFSKTYAMTGWRVGYLVAPVPLAPVLQKLQEPLVSCVNTAAQVAADAALRGPQNAVATMVAAYRHRRDALVDALGSSGVEHWRPSGAFYTWARLTGYRGTAVEFALRLLEEQNVAVAPGTAFGPSGEGWIRLSLATDEALLLEGAARIVALLEK
jgi:aspartate/methionine/tyrosine aminotransferase